MCRVDARILNFRQKFRFDFERNNAPWTRSRVMPHSSLFHLQSEKFLTHFLKNNDDGTNENGCDSGSTGGRCVNVFIESRICKEFSKKFRRLFLAK
jgi:hypothetical protein